VSNGLSGYSSDELLEELVKRRNNQETEEVVSWCHDCVNFKAGTPETPKNKLCSFRHKMNFRVPRDIGEAHDGEYGYYRRVCKDRKLIEIPQ
jgi:hypothetical protein